MVPIDHTLNYLRESLSNYMDNEMCQEITRKMEANHYVNEGHFVKDLSEEEMTYLNDVLENELDYAKSVQHDIRVKELTEIYELLF
ncbi:sporulation protein [Virgibacillus xinjiangensis]|uniref:Sporulation protein n=1 Tax=Virgibacillus xinjiangensis TaxID=393090 RepID=A0ABV7CQU4_9BACI